MLGIIGAMREEIEELKLDIIDLEIKSIGSLIFYFGKLFNKNVVLSQCGIGKVNAGIVSTLMISLFDTNTIIFTGVAGAIDKRLNIGDIVIGTYLIEHDFDVTSFGGKPGEIPRMDTWKFPSDKNLVELSYEIAKKTFDDINIFKGIILSGDEFVSSPDKIKWLKDTFDGMCTEMEGAAVAHVCHVLKTPCLIIRSISDKADGNAHVDFKEFLNMSSKKSKILVSKIIENL
ncbi:MAG: 5'-methylthioadenosine/adenosylhomocysteine nucleosidase [Fusobacteriaceae bacterium]|jgi:adenosylhomocysteine nucleosidase|nr:5'-methylthioadenosine/adenosylhomocysteine nucleosidase [Fusobacteriaceae bacterium]